MRRRDFLSAVAGSGLAAAPPVPSRAQSSSAAWITQGPMVGGVSEHAATIWVRASHDFPVQVEAVGPDGTVHRSAEQVANPDNDFCMHLRLLNLLPATTYRYRLIVAGVVDVAANDPLLAYGPDKRFRTPPSRSGTVRIGFGSCCMFREDPEQPIWRAVADCAPDQFLWLGDNVYADTDDYRVLCENYRQQRNVASLQPVLSNISHVAIWDDHDYGINDGDGSFVGKHASLQAFKAYWANPAYGLSGVPGTFFKFSAGDIDFLMLDVRYHRENSSGQLGDRATLLGAEQRAWLKSALKDSRAVFKVIASGCAWARTKGPGSDTWFGHLSERTEIFEFIREEQIGGCVFLSGGPHVGELNCVPWSERGGYDYYDLVSSGLAKRQGHASWLERRPEIRVRQVYFGGNNFGLLEFDTTSSEPQLTFTLRDVVNRSVWEPLILTSRDLTNGVQSWRKSIDEISLRRYDRSRAGEPYYGAIDYSADTPQARSTDLGV